MGVDQNGRDTAHPDAGPDASAYQPGTVTWGQPGQPTPQESIVDAEFKADNAMTNDQSIVIVTEAPPQEGGKP